MRTHSYPLFPPFVLLLLGTFASCTTFSTSDPSEAKLLKDEEASIARRAGLGEGDVVEIRVYREPDLTGIYRVAPRGEIEFPLIGKIKILGRDSFEVADEIRNRLAQGYLQNPQVSIFVREHNSQKIHVLGQVNKPGSFSYETGMTVIEAVTNAGGFTKLASTNAVRVTRSRGGTEQRYVLPVGDIGNGKAPNFELEPGDIVFIPETIF